MFKTTLIAAIALAGAQAIKISSQATSETSAGPFSSGPSLLQPGSGVTTELDLNSNITG